MIKREDGKCLRDLNEGVFEIIKLNRNCTIVLRMKIQKCKKNFEISLYKLISQHQLTYHSISCSDCKLESFLAHCKNISRCFTISIFTSDVFEKFGVGSTTQSFVTGHHNHKITSCCRIDRLDKKLTIIANITDQLSQLDKIISHIFGK